MNTKKFDVIYYTKLFIKALIVLLGIIGNGHNVFAVDGKVYLGSNCHYGLISPSTEVAYYVSTKYAALVTQQSKWSSVLDSTPTLLTLNNIRGF